LARFSENLIESLALPIAPAAGPPKPMPFYGIRVGGSIFH
jgi:hypothetical protein